MSTAEQLDFSHVRASDPATSRQAAEQVNINARCAEILKAARAFTLYVDSTFTDGELAAYVNDDRNIVARRRLDLLERGLVEAVWKDGEQETRRGRRGRDELVWRVTP